MRCPASAQKSRIVGGLHKVCSGGCRGSRRGRKFVGALKTTAGSVVSLLIWRGKGNEGGGGGWAGIAMVAVVVGGTPYVDKHEFPGSGCLMHITRVGVQVDIRPGGDPKTSPTKPIHACRNCTVRCGKWLLQTSRVAGRLVSRKSRRSRYRGCGCHQSGW